MQQQQQPYGYPLQPTQQQGYAYDYQQPPPQAYDPGAAVAAYTQQQQQQQQPQYAPQYGDQQQQQQQPTQQQHVPVTMPMGNRQGAASAGAAATPSGVSLSTPITSVGRPSVHKKFDWVLVVSKTARMAHARGCCACCRRGAQRGMQVATRDYVENCLQKAGLLWSTVQSADGDDYLIRVTATQARLEFQAEADKLELPTKMVGMTTPSGLPVWGAAAPFERQKRGMFADEFSTAVRQLLIKHIIEDPAIPYSGYKALGFDRGADLNLTEMVASGRLQEAFPLHDVPTKRVLLSTWGSPSKLFRRQPMSAIREYFGEKIALYFAFLGFYTMFLIVPAIVGIPVQFLQLFGGVYANAFSTVIFAVGMTVWATVFLEFWKRRQATLAYKWGVFNFEETERPRASCRGERRLGFYSEGGFVALDDQVDTRGRMSTAGGAVDMYTQQPIEPTVYVPSRRAACRLVSALPVLLIMIAVVCIVALSVFLLRVLFIDNNSFGPCSSTGTVIDAVNAYFNFCLSEAVASGVNALILAVAVIILNFVYARIARVLNDWENHRTQTEYDDSLIFKTFLFQFVNSYFALFYIAFFKSKYQLCLFGRCVVDRCTSNDCFFELFQQLAIIMVAKQFALQISEVLIPLIKWRLRLRRVRAEREQAKRDGRVTTWTQAEHESTLNTYEGVFDDYSELIIQFGYATLFVTAFPVAPTLALVANVIEIRADAWKLLRTFKRPVADKAEDIGSWYNILEVMTTVAVITNMFVVSFTSVSIASVNGWTITQRLWFAFIVEHAVLLLRFMIAYFIPDVPGRVLKEVAKKAWIQDRQNPRQFAPVPAHITPKQAVDGSVDAPEPYDEDE